MVHLLAFSLQDQVEKYGAYVGLAAFIGLAVLSLLYFAQARELKRFFHGNATDTELDSAGRVMLTPRQMEHGAIGREVVITGAGDCLELWDRSAWEAYDRDLAQRAPDLTASLGHPA